MSFLALLEHKQVLRSLESKNWYRLYNKNLVELACSVRIAKILEVYGPRR